ncbi:MAG: S-layer homology domain-containing protein [Oscillospiraceae bacterium]|nr:S-layer homology domain-containing protein [Oscillospiraceae bacterium]
MRRLLIFIAFFLLASAVPVCADEALILYSGFESRAEVRKWDGGVLSDLASTEGDFACAVNNAYGEENDGLVSHVLFYSETVSLTPGEIYRVSFDVMGFGAPGSGRVSADTHFGDGVNNIAFEFDGIGDDWTNASAFFMVPDEAEYSFLLELKNGDIDMGFLIDNFEIRKIDLEPVSLTISGPEELTIPIAGERSVRYSVEGRTADGEIISVLSGISALEAVNLPAGVIFDGENGIITVNESCPDGASFTLTCTPPDYLKLRPTSLRVHLTKNLLLNSDFSQGGDFWDVDNGYELGSSVVGNYMTLFTEWPNPYGYSASLRQTEPIMLVEGMMYVFRATVRVESGSDSSAYSQNTALSRDGEIIINIIDLSAGDWTEVFAAFTPEFSGVYNLTLNFTTADYGIVNVSNMSLSPEPPEETFLTLHAPGNISIPDTMTEFPLNAYVRDQAGNVISSRCRLSLYPDGKGVELTSSGIKVSPDATAGEYEVYATSISNPSLENSLYFTVSYDNIADGGFEEYGANYRWAAAAPAVLRISENIDGHFARITSDGDFAVVINNSYMHLYADTPYAFRADIVGGKGSVVTAFIETVDGEMIPVVQSSTEDGRIFELFQTDYDIIGRLLLHISSSEGRSIDLWIDNVELFRSIVSVSAPKIRGLAESGAVLTADYEFFNNLDETNDDSACAISWYGMSSSGGDHIRVGSGSEFTVLPELVGRYVYFEITPICAVTGLSGLPVQSVPLAIGSLRDDGILNDPSNDPSSDTSHDAPIAPDEPAEKPELSPVELPQVEGGDIPFEDMGQHWADKYVLPLYLAGVVNGRYGFIFGPDDIVTRAEFAAMLSRSFGADGGFDTFVDVPEDAWYRGAVAALSHLGIVNGTSATEFSPEAQVNREEMTAMLIRIFEIMGGESSPASLDRFYDNTDISDWARSSVAEGLRIGLVNGTEQSTFAPKRGATRAEACAMICRLLDILSSMEEKE